LAHPVEIFREVIVMSQACKKCSSSSISERKEYDFDNGEEQEYTIFTCNNCGYEWSPGGEILGTVAGYAALASAGLL